MNKKSIDMVQLLKKVTDEPVAAEVLYANFRLIDDLFENLFGGTTNLIESIEQISEKALKTEAQAGLGGALAALFLDLKASLKAEGKIGKQTKTTLEKGLTLQKKIRLCEACLEDQDKIIDNPASIAETAGKYLRLTDKLNTYAMIDEDLPTETLGPEASNVVRDRWRKDQAQTKDAHQVALIMSHPFYAAAIVKVQPETAGSTYITYPSPPGKKRAVVAEFLYEEKGVSFLKTFWVIDIPSD